MSDLSLGASDDAHESPNVRQMRERIKALEEQARAADEARQKAERLEKELAIRDAGIDLDQLQRKALFAVHEGEFSPDAIRETATKLGFAAPVQQAPEVPADELARLRQLQSASAGAPTGTVAQSDADADFYARLQQARTEQEFDAIYRSSGRPMAR